MSSLQCVCVCVCGYVCVCVSFYAHIHCVLSTFCPCMFDFWLGYNFYCLDCDKLWATNTAVWYYIVAHCGLSGHLWHCKYVNYVGVWSFSCLPSFPPSFLLHPIHSLLSSPRYTALKKIPLRSLCFSSHGMFMCLRVFFYEHKALWHWQLLPASLLMCRVCVPCCCMFINGNRYQQNVAKSQLSGRIVYSSSYYRREPAVL